VQVKVALAQRQRFADAQPGPPEDHDQGAQPYRVVIVAGGVHHGDDSSTVGGSAG
jgi:hypothetical protein